MKKISLKSLNLHAVEQLSRAQLKDVFGGSVKEEVGPEMQVCTCGADCDVIASADRTCTEVCSNYDCNS